MKDIIKFPIPNFPLYELHYTDEEQKVYNTKTNRYITNKITPKGYYHVLLHNNGVNKDYYIHRLVYYSFNGEIPEGMQINHINEIKNDNNINNLNLMTPKENTNWGNGIKKRVENTNWVLRSKKRKEKQLNN